MNLHQLYGHYPLLTLLVFISICTLYLPASAAAAAEDNVQLTVSSVTAVEGEDIVISVSISGNSGLAAAELMLKYDNTKLTYKSSAAGTAAQESDCYSAINESYKTEGNFTTVMDSFMSAYGITAAGEMFSITFIIKQGWVGSIPLNLTVRDFCDINSNTIPHTIIDGSVIDSSTYIAARAGSTTVIDRDNNMIYGLTPGTNEDQFVSNCVELNTGYSLLCTPAGTLGTGTRIDIVDTATNALVESFEIVIFGDVNGDGSVDSIDAGTVIDVENYMTTWDPTANAAYIRAGDINGDGSIDSIDAGLFVDTENYLMSVNQITGVASLITSIEGTVTINGTAEYGKTLTADVSGITPTGAPLTYVWKSAGVVAGNGSTYIVKAEDIGKSVTVTVTGLWTYTGSIRSVAVKPTKAVAAAPYVPVLVSKTLNSVTLAAIAGQEYKINEGEWQANNVFTGLTPDTAYSFYTRIAETATYFVSPASQALNVTTYSSAVSGTVAITGTAKYGETLTADISDINVPAESITCQWKRGENDIGDGSTYIITADDIGQSITVLAIGFGDYSGSVTSAAVLPTKADALTTPSVPSMLSKTSSTITLNVVIGQEYKIEGGAWQTSGVFIDLSPNTAYNFYTRYAETETHLSSANSPALSVTTNKDTISGIVVIAGTPAVGGTLTVDVSGVTPAGATLTYVWKSDGMTVGSSSTYTVLEDDLGCSLTVTVTGAGNYMGSLISAAVAVAG